MEQTPDPIAPIETQEELEPELYVEPPRMTAKDMIGVVVALIALGLIGYAGYVWLNPDLSLQTVFKKNNAPVHSTAVDSTVKTNVTDVQPEAATEDYSCAQCGMFADKSSSHVQVSWAGGDKTHHDSWDCVFKYAKAQSLVLESAQVLDYATGIGGRMLDAGSAWYLYDTEASVEGSMSPYIAAFKDQAAAQAAQPEMGGEPVDFTGLKAKWE